MNAYKVIFKGFDFMNSSQILLNKLTINHLVSAEKDFITVKKIQPVKNK